MACETWLLTSWKERRLRVLKKKTLRRIFGQQRDEVTRDWSKIYSEELNYLYSTQNII
jgi:hypothetical protein